MKTDQLCLDGYEYSTHYAILYWIVLHCTALYWIGVHSTILYCTVIYFTARYYTLLHSTIINCTVLYFTAMYCTLLHCSIINCTVLYCTVLLYPALHLMFFCPNLHGQYHPDNQNVHGIHSIHTYYLDNYKYQFKMLDSGFRGFTSEICLGGY